MSELLLIKEQIKNLQSELNRMVENLEKDTVISSEVTEMSERLDVLIVELHRLG